MFQPVALLTEHGDFEHAVFGRHLGRFTAFYDRFVTQAVGDQVGDRNDLQAVFLRHFEQLRQAGHRTVFVHDLDQCSGGLQSGQSSQVHGGFGMSRTAQNAFLTGSERVDVPRTPQVGGFGLRVGQCPQGRRAVVDRNARSAAFAQQIDRHGERRAEQRSVVRLHHVEFELCAALFGKRSTQHTATVLEHEIDDFGRHLLGCYDEVAFVFPVFVIDDDDDFSLAEILDGFFYRIQYFFVFHGLFYFLFLCAKRANIPEIFSLIFLNFTTYQSTSSSPESFVALYVR